MLLVGYGVIVIVSAILYILVSGDRRFPLHFVFLLSITIVCAWGIRTRHRWAWALTAIFAAWQIYAGTSNLFVIGNAVVRAPMAVKLVVGSVALRTVILLVLFVILLFFSDRQVRNT